MLSGSQPPLRKNGILSFSKMWSPLGLAGSPGSIAKKMCFKIVLTYVVHILYITHSYTTQFAGKAWDSACWLKLWGKLHVPWKMFVYPCLCLHIFPSLRILSVLYRSQIFTFDRTTFWFYFELSCLCLALRVNQLTEACTVYSSSLVWAWKPSLGVFLLRNQTFVFPRSFVNLRFEFRDCTAKFSHISSLNSAVHFPKSDL